MKPIEDTDKYSFFELLECLRELRRFADNKNKELGTITIDSKNEIILKAMLNKPYYTLKEEWMQYLMEILKFEIIERLFNSYEG